MAKYQIFSDNEWIFPDSVMEETTTAAALYAARGADVCFQVLTDLCAKAGDAFSISAKDLPAGCEIVSYQLQPAHVSENSDVKFLTTTDYESVKDFVTRKAPFDVYEITRPLDGGKMLEGRVALYFRINVDTESVPGSYSFVLTVHAGEETLEIPVSLKVYRTQIPKLQQAKFHMINWVFYNKIAEHHHVEQWSEEYWKILDAYLDNQLDMRNDYLRLPGGIPVRDEAGQIVDFDFTHVEEVGNFALKKGFTYILGDFVARFAKWDDPEQYLLWDRAVGTSSLEGYRQLKIYFTKAWECVCRNNWQEQYMQTLVDEPQFPNSMSYRALSGICRKYMPGVIINDPVESTDLEGAVDIWVVKQAVYEKHIETYRKLQEIGEEIWLYTCGYPSGKMMNRVVDLPLTVSRLPMWMCVLYDAKGFLHWGYNYHDAAATGDTCYDISNGKYPSGNDMVIYPGEGRPDYAVRGHSQRTGALDAELFLQLSKRPGGREKAVELITKVCRTFEDYDPSAQLFDQVRHELLEILG